MNSHLKQRNMKVEDLSEITTGIPLIELLEQISGKTLPLYKKNPSFRMHKLENCLTALKFIKEEGIPIISVGAEDLVDVNIMLVLGLLWMIILKYQVKKHRGNANPKEALLQWVQSKIPEKDLVNFSSCWQDGTALCGLIEVLKPGTIPNAKQLSSVYALDNATLGTDKAETELDIPKILVPEDMVTELPDEFCIIAYISYFRDYDEKNSIRKTEEPKTHGNDVVTEKSTSYGPGLEAGLAHEPVNFTIEARNADNERVNHGGTFFRVNVANGSEFIEVQIQDEGNGLYQVTYTPSTPGKYTVEIKLGDKHINGSPWQFDRTWYS
jgi:hypothetical protein